MEVVFLDGPCRTAQVVLPGQQVLDRLHDESTEHGRAVDRRFTGSRLCYGLLIAIERLGIDLTIMSIHRPHDIE